MKTVKASITSLLPHIYDAFDHQQDISFTVKGRSMEPSLQDNKSKVTLEAFSGHLQKKHIYLYKLNDKVLLHRYIKSKDGIHYFLGDNCSSYEYVSKSDIIGKVIKVDENAFQYSLKTALYLFLRRVKIQVYKKRRVAS